MSRPTVGPTPRASVSAGICTAATVAVRGERNEMADLVLVSVVLGFFGLCLLYVRGCERIIRGDETSDSTTEPARETTAR